MSRVPPTPASAPKSPAAAPRALRVLGLDPGSRLTGWGVVDCQGGKLAYVASGTLRAGSGTFASRLHEIFTGVHALCAEYAPQEVAIERVFMAKNPDSALKLGQARGAALCATFDGLRAIAEYAPREVKLAVVGTGAAEKTQVQAMIRRLLALQGRLGADAADALAIAVCHAHTRTSPGALAAAASAAAGTPAPARRRSPRAAWGAALAGRLAAGTAR